MFNRLKRNAPSRKIRSGNVIFAAGSKVEYVYLMLSGAARAIVYPDNAKNVSLFQLGPGEFVGEDQVDREFYRYSAVVDETGEFAMIERERFLQEIQLCGEVLTHFSRRIGKLIDSVERLGIASAERRILHLLNSICDSNDTVRVRGRIGEFSSQLDLASETIYRSLKKLETHGAIQRLQNGTVRVANQKIIKATD